VDHWDLGPPWTDLHCRLKELIGLWPFRGSRPTTKGRGEWRTGNSMGRSPEIRRQRGGRVMNEGGGGRKLAVGAHSDVRDEARRTVWGEVR
jgi:hypothetical protein